MSENENNEDPKIIVDEDWKSQVEKEKEELLKTDDSAAATPAEDEQSSELPPASFLGLLSMLGSQAMANLGVLPDFATGETHVNRPLAKHCIDMIGVLQDKTKNNLTEDEAGHIRDALHQLRMMFVSTANAPNAPTTAPSDQEPPAEPGSSIELP